MNIKRCEYCGKEYEARTSRKRFCSDICRSRANRERKDHHIIRPRKARDPEEINKILEEVERRKEEKRKSGDLFAILLDLKQKEPFGLKYWETFQKIAERDNAVYTVNDVRTDEEFFPEAVTFLIEVNRIIITRRIK